MSQEGKNEYEQLANELFMLQETENDGRGINCVRDIASYWRMGDVESARQIAWTDNDKIRNYPRVQRWLEDNLFGPDNDSPLKSSERMKKRLSEEDS